MDCANWTLSFCCVNATSVRVCCVEAGCTGVGEAETGPFVGAADAGNVEKEDEEDASEIPVEVDAFPVFLCLIVVKGECGLVSVSSVLLLLSEEEVDV